MKFEYLKAAQVVVLGIQGLTYNNPLLFLLSSLLSLSLRNPYRTADILSILGSLLPCLGVLEYSTFILPAINIVLVIVMGRPDPESTPLPRKYLLPLFFLPLSITTMNENQYARNIQLALLILTLILHHFQLPSKNHLISFLRIILAIETIFLGIFIFFFPNFFDNDLFTNHSPWYLLSFLLANLFGTFIGNMPLQQIENKELLDDNIRKRSVISSKSQAQPVEMQQIKAISQKIKRVQIVEKAVKEEQKQQTQIKQKDLFPAFQGQAKIQIDKKDQLTKSNQPKRQTNEKQGQNYNEQTQGQSLNLLFIIPFCLLDQGLFQLPIYAYMMCLIWSKGVKYMFPFMFLCSTLVSMRAWESVGTIQNIGLRLLLVILVDKNIAGGAQVGQLVKGLWLRVSFVFVLSILFWFSLITVNIFHLILICIILIFITHDSQPGPSFRHKNWHYLTALLNLFLISRIIYRFFLEQQWTTKNIPLNSLFELTGIGFPYTGQGDLFNLTPLLINAIVGLQQLTYRSRIYQLELKSGVFQGYRQRINAIARVVTIIYYKLLPWLSYACVIFLLILLDFSVSSSILMFWLLLSLANQILRKNSLDTYKRLHFLWLVYLRLASLQVLLRYVFQFAKFDLVYILLSPIPFFQVLIRYEELLGLAIRDSTYIYLKTVSKFQLMISTDLMGIFIAFLVMEYYSLLIKYYQGESQEAERNRIEQIYRDYIDFKLTKWIQGFRIYKVIKFFCHFYVEMFFPLLGLFACAHLSFLMLSYLIIALFYYLALNLHYYRTHIEDPLGNQLNQLLLSWRGSPLFRKSQALREVIAAAGRIIVSSRIKQHDNIRPWIVLLTLTSLLLTYFSRILRTPQIVQILNEQRVLLYRWLLYIGGCSIQLGIIAHASKVILILIIIQLKCCWFLQKFQEISQNNPAKEQEKIIEDVLTSGHIDDISHQKLEGEISLSYGEEGQQSANEQQFQLRQGRKYSQMQASVLLGLVKMLERSFVMLLVFASIVQSSHPFGLVYLLCALLLNYMGSVSIKILSRILATLVILQYLLLLVNFTDKRWAHVPNEFARYQTQSLISSILHLPPQWEDYLTFGKTGRQLIILPLSFLIVACYQLYFIFARATWNKVLRLLQKNIELSKIQKRILGHLLQIYHYSLMYSPLFLILLSLAIYLLDYTTTNMLLTLLSALFVFVSFLVKNYHESKQFWKVYFLVLQFMIVCFMALYALLQIPMLAPYCSHLLCSSEELHTQFTKALLLFLLQIGIDLVDSAHFADALARMRHDEYKVDYFRLAVAYKHNDKKIAQLFKQMQKELELKNNVGQVLSFLQTLKQNPLAEFRNVRQAYDSKESWIDVLLDVLPSLVDSAIVLTARQAKQIVKDQNKHWIALKGFSDEDLRHINDSYIDHFGDLNGYHQITTQIESVVSQSAEIKKPNLQQKNEDLEDSSGESIRQTQRKSFARQLPEQAQELSGAFRQQIRQSRRQGMGGQKVKSEKKQLLYLLILQSVLSNWHYLTYFVLVLQHIRNVGLLTLPLPVVSFCFGLVSSYRAGKGVWRALFLLLLLPLLFKFLVRTGMLVLPEDVVYLLIGQNLDSVLSEYLGLVFIVGQCIILKIIGHFHEGAQEIQCMRIALVRNLVNGVFVQEKPALLQLLKEAESVPLGQAELVFARTECKPGYDFTTVGTSLQLGLLVYVFLCYDQMAIRKEITFYEMIQYNQFAAGMVALTLIQLAILLFQRFISITDLKQASKKWDISLILKYALFIATLTFVQLTVLVFFPLNSDNYSSNNYITVFLALYSLYFLVSALQVKNGLDQKSRGFMDRYTWYNGFVYIGYRAIPFLFEFKAFSDWTFTRTALRIFDWIRLQEIFGRLYVAKCNALFLQGKQLGSKIQWWKKLLMGYPLLISIILLLFGPLVLFSALNPLASLNEVNGGYLQVVLRVNKTNQYPLYTNSHITDIQPLIPDLQDQQLIKSYDLDPETLQTIILQQYSDQYWQISEGSYYKLLGEPEGSLYELTIRAKLDRNQTGLTALYILSSYEIPHSRIPQLKQALLGETIFVVQNLVHEFIRLDNNGGLHFLGDSQDKIVLRAEQGQKAKKQYWIIEGGLRLKVASDKYTRAIFGYSVMSFYISIILVIANYFRFLFQGSVHTIIMADIPHADPVLALCDAVYQARREHDLQLQERLFWTIIDLIRSPDNLLALTGNFLEARLETLAHKQKAD